MSFVYPYELWDFFVLILCRMPLVIWLGLHWICLLLWVVIVIFMMILIFPLQEHGMSLHLFVSSLISFISILLSSQYRSFVSLCKFIPWYFILFVAVINGIVSLISLSDHSWECKRFLFCCCCCCCCCVCEMYLINQQNAFPKILEFGFGLVVL